jgi:hypothetical protein
MGNNQKKLITVRSVGTPNFELAAQMLAPLLFLKTHESNQAREPTPAQLHDELLHQGKWHPWL